MAEQTFAGGAVGLPSWRELPNVNLEVINFHRPALGTFQAKFMLADRRVALYQPQKYCISDLRISALLSYRCSRCQPTPAEVDSCRLLAGKANFLKGLLLRRRRLGGCTS